MDKVRIKMALLAAVAAVAMACGCNGEGEVKPHEDFPVLASAKSGEATVYLSEVRRQGKRIYLLFMYRDSGDAVKRASLVCTEITGGLNTEFEREEKGGWVELRCETDYPREAKELGFTLRMCEEPVCEKADVVISAEVPEVGTISMPDLSAKAGGVRFSVDTIANLEGDEWPQLDASEIAEVVETGGKVIPYGGKNVVVKGGEESVLVVICKAEFPDKVPELPRGYAEWDQVIFTSGEGKNLGGATSTSDTGSTRYYAQLSVGMKEVPETIKACFFSTETLSSFRREFVFSGLANPQ